MKILRPMPTVVTLLVAALLVSLLWRPLPTIQPQPKEISRVQTQTASMPWPSYGQQALGAVGYGVLTTHGQQTPVPIASVTKVITALAILRQKPLNVGEQGPLITINQNDFDLYNYYYSNDGSVAKVAVGEQISEYQALQTMLLPSANNMADTLADWAFGSMDNYLAFANKMVQDLGLTQTTVNGANGFYNETTSTAADVVKLGIAALNNPVIAQISNQPEAEVPVAGTVQNYNWLLGEQGVIGIKTGNTDKAGGCFLFASQRSIEGQNVTVVGAVLSAPTLNDSIADTRRVLSSVDSAFQVITPIKQGQVVASYIAPWGKETNAVAQKNIKLLIWKGQNISVSSNVKPINSGAPANKDVGTISVAAGAISATSPVVLETKMPGPSITWQLTNF